MKVSDIRIVYFVGIGGIGMSALARYFNALGKEVHGYDKTETALTKTLVEEGMIVHYDEDLTVIPKGVDLVIYTPAIPKDHKELVYFKAHGFPVMKRAQALGLISQDLKTIAIAGTHGKTTTSSLTTWLLRHGGIDCSAFLGGIAENFKSNYLTGKSEWVVIEADEYDRSFLHLHPDLAVILSMDADHLDIYGDKNSLLETGFKAFVNLLAADGQVLVQCDYYEEFANNAQAVPYGIGKAIYSVKNIRVENGAFVFDYESPQCQMKDLVLSLPGRHNIENACAAITIALKLGVAEAKIREGLQLFKGIKRRFEHVYKDEHIAYIDDYAHHPTELNAAISAAKELYAGKKVTGIFQPHLYSRTRDFEDDFAAALSQLDEVWMMGIYPAREMPIAGVTADVVLNKVDNSNKRRLTKATLLEAVKEWNGDVLMTLGAGDINTFVEPIKNILAQKASEGK